VKVRRQYAPVVGRIVVNADLSRSLLTSHFSSAALTVCCSCDLSVPVESRVVQLVY